MAKTLRPDGNKILEYGVWTTIRARCNNPNNSNWKSYGGLGVAIDPRWDNYDQFVADVGPRPFPEARLLRRDPLGNFNPENCYWGTPKDQRRNQRGSLKLEYEGKQVTYGELSDRCGIPWRRLYVRVHVEGWSIERAISTPMGTKTRQKKVKK